ncbi:MAG: hypothetical protein V3U78_04540 [Thiotrichaceae bacterium]
MKTVTLKGNDLMSLLSSDIGSTHRIKVISIRKVWYVLLEYVD